MAANSDKSPDKYGNTQQTIGVLMSDTRYQAFKRLILGSGRQINRVVRDLIEQEFKEELDKIEQRINDESGSQESKSSNSKANARRQHIA